MSLILFINILLFQVIVVSVKPHYLTQYFVILCRDVTLGYKSVSLDAVVQMKASGKYHTLVPKHSLDEQLFFPDRIICEDSRSGFHFIKNTFDTYVDKICYAKESEDDESGGRTKIAKFIDRCVEEFLCIVFDTCAIGTEFDKIETSIKKNNKKVCFIDWLSFEYYILKSFMSNYNKSILCKCLINGKCITCKEADMCNYEHFSMNELLYWKVKDLLALCRNHCVIDNG